MRPGGCMRSALFAAAAGAGAVIWLLAAGPILGGRRALMVLLAILPAAWVLAIAPRGPRALRASALATIVGAVLAAATATLGELALALGLLLGLLRSGLVYRLPPGRAVLVEVVLVGAGLLFARFLAAYSALSVGLAVWGFFLVQCAYFLLGPAREHSTIEPDPFAEALRRAAAILDGQGV